MSLPRSTISNRQEPVQISTPFRDSSPSGPDPFPSVHIEPASATISTSQRDWQDDSDGARPRGGSGTSTLAGRLRSASKKFETSTLPKGMWDATASIASSIPSLTDIRRGSFGSDGWSAEGQLEERERRLSLVRSRSSQIAENGAHERNLGGPRSPHEILSLGSLPHPNSAPAGANHERYQEPSGKKQAPAVDVGKSISDEKDQSQRALNSASSTDKGEAGSSEQDFTSSAITHEANTNYMTTPFENGYQFPPKHTLTEATKIALIGFWNYTTTWLGFLVVVYGLNIVAWGGMIFLLLCNAAPAMCYPTCDDINSPRRIWIEYDSQILTALFCVTGFGLIPWRFRDLFYLLKYRLKKDKVALRRLAGIHRDWFRLEGSQNLPVLLGPDNMEAELEVLPVDSLPYPLKSIPDAPLTGIRAPPTPVWKLDYVIWNFVWNTFLQAVLSGLMWGLNRYDRPSWSTGVFVALACIVAALGGIMIFNEGKKVKAVEGIPVSLKDQERLKRDKEMGILHINNITDAIPKEKGHKRSKLLGKSKVRGGTTHAGTHGTTSTELDELPPKGSD